MKSSTKKAWKKFGKAFVKGAKETGKEAGEFLGEGVKTVYREGKKIIVGPTLEEQKAKLVQEKREFEVQKQRADLERQRRELGYRSTPEKFRDFTRGASKKLDEAVLPQRQVLTSKKYRKFEDVRIKRRNVTSMLSSPALRL